MQNSVSRRLMLFFVKAIFVVALMVMAGFSAVVSLQFPIFYYFFDALAALGLVSGVSLVLDFRKIQQINWSNNPEEQEIPLAVDDSIAVKVAKRYVSNATYAQIKAEFGFQSNEQVTRAIKQRLKETL